MAPSIVHLPNGQNLTVSPVFGGLFFKSSNVNNHHSPFPAGWTVVLNTEDDAADDADSFDALEDDSRPSRRPPTHRYKKPTLHNDHLFISSISNPNSNDYKPAGSPTRQIAMMLWATLWWYFHQPPPDPRLTNEHSIHTADEGKPHGEWRININREGIFTGKVLLPKLERMGLISSEESCVGIYQDDRAGEGWLNMFVSRRSFWQMDPRIYLYTMSAVAQSPYPAGSPYTSRPSSPNGEKKEHSPEPSSSAGLWSPAAPGPFHSTSHLPTFYPPPPQQYKFTNNVRHPIRPKPPRQGEVFYTRFVPSVGQYLSFRVASLAPKPPPHRGPSNVSSPNVAQFRQSQIGEAWPPTVQNLNLGPCDLDLLEKWMNDPRVAKAWGEDGPKEKQEAFLRANMSSKHSFPVIGCWDGKPFGYFELYWVKEDALGKHLPHVGDYDRGFHCLVGEQEYRGPHRARIWLSALAHYCFLADNRTDTVMLEPRVDNEKLKQYCTDVGFFKEREISFPHKQSNLFKIKRDGWVGPEL